MKVNHGMIDMKGISITIDNLESYIKLLPEEDFDKWFQEGEIPKETLFSNSFYKMSAFMTVMDLLMKYFSI